MKLKFYDIISLKIYYSERRSSIQVFFIIFVPWPVFLYSLSRTWNVNVLHCRLYFTLMSSMILSIYHTAPKSWIEKPVSKFLIFIAPQLLHASRPSIMKQHKLDESQHLIPSDTTNAYSKALHIESASTSQIKRLMWCKIALSQKNINFYSLVLGGQQTLYLKHVFSFIGETLFCGIRWNHQQEAELHQFSDLPLNSVMQS